MYTNSRSIFLYSRNYHTIVKQLYSSLKKQDKETVCDPLKYGKVHSSQLAGLNPGYGLEHIKDHMHYIFFTQSNINSNSQLITISDSLSE